MLGNHRAWCLVLLPPMQPTSPMTRGSESTCPMARVKQVITQDNKAKHPRKLHATRIDCCHFGNRRSNCLSAHNAHNATIHQLSAAMRPRCQGRNTTSTAKIKFQKAERGEDVLAPPMGSQPLLRWDRGPLSVPYRLGNPAYRL
jgi:hypothetical protein